ncbi:MAG: L-aspartate oxidase [Ignavibacteria bacterium]|nr:L-aspartate oxidase [Ignavibacteria bacterium]
MQEIRTEILVIGSGVAGLISALTAADLGREVLVISKLPTLLSGNTPWAQGGIVFLGKDDSPEKLKKDIIDAGHYHSWEPAVDFIVQEGPRLVKELLIEKYGVLFDRNADGELHLTSEGAHSTSRIIHSKDKTGEIIHLTLIEKAQKHPNIKFLVDHTAVDLLTLSHHSTKSTDIYEKPTCFGAFVLNNQTGKVFPIFAYNTILATGGLGQIYLHTTNPPEATGDGIAMAYRAGVRLLNLQFIQFHPTAFYSERVNLLISEAVRGEGGKLIDKYGREFMNEYHENGSLAPRDIVARSIHQTMLKTNHPCVYLDISFKSSDWIKSRFPTIYQNLLKAGIDMTVEPIPVVPAAHYSCGGLGVSLKGKTSLSRLYAVGEVACTGVHGANRLASTSLLEGVVWGYHAGKSASEINKSDQYIPEIFPWKDENEYIDPALIAQDWLTIKNTMWNYVGLVRTRQRLTRATTILRHLQNEIEQFYKRAKMNKEILQLRNGIITAIAVTNASIEDKVSRGAHYLEN